MTGIESKNRRFAAIPCRFILFLLPLILTGCGMGLNEPDFQSPVFRGIFMVGDTLFTWIFWTMIFFCVLFIGRLGKGYGPNWSVLLAALTGTTLFWIPLFVLALVLKPTGYLSDLFRFRYPLYSVVVFLAQPLPFYLAFALSFYFFSRPSIRSVGKQGRLGDVDKLIEYTRSTEYRIQQAAVQALGECGKTDPGLNDRVYRFLKNVFLFRRELQDEAAGSLASMGHDAAIRIVSDLRSLSDPLGCRRMLDLLYRIDSLMAFEFLEGFASTDPEAAIRAGRRVGELFPDRWKEWLGYLKERNTPRSLFGRRALLASGDPEALEQLASYDRKKQRLTVTLSVVRRERTDSSGLKRTEERESREYRYDGKKISLTAGKSLECSASGDRESSPMR